MPRSSSALSAKVAPVSGGTAQLIKSNVGLEVAFVHPDSVHGVLVEVIGG